jgi:phage virion morphogenesis protein
MSKSVTINDLEVQTALAKLAQQIRNKDPVLNAIGGEVLKRVQMNFRNSQSPEGAPWAPLKKRAGKPLLDTTRLRNSITCLLYTSDAADDM